MNKGQQESPNPEINVSRVNCASLGTSGMVADPGYVLMATITSGGDVFLGYPTLVSFAFHRYADGIT
jgi:hypothetical protein